MIEEVLVTAQRRTTSAQDVGASVNVLSESMLEAAKIDTSQDLQVVVPGLLISQDIGLSNQVFIRGIGNNLLGLGSGNSVATYLDGVFLPNSTQAFRTLYDVQRVEVLKGPQAVLYGRNATGGAILIEPNKAEFESTASIEARFGNYDHREITATVNGTLIEDVLAGRLAARYSDRDGYAENLYNGVDQDYEETTAVRGSLKILASENLTIDIVADYTDIESGEFKKAVNEDGWTYLLAPPDQFSPDPRASYRQYDSSQPSEEYGARVSLDWLTDLGIVTSVTSYREFEAGPIVFDNDGIGVPGTLLGLPFQISFNGNVIESEQFYHETFIATPEENRLQALVGFSYFEESASDYSNRYVGFGIARNDRKLEAEAYSVFADLTYRLTDTVSIIAGGRYSHEDKQYSQRGLDPSTNAELSFSENDNDWSEFTPRFGIEYRPNDDVMMYATATNGFKSGGFNESNPLNDFDPESVWGYEVGVKSTLAQGRVQANLAAFYYDYEDLQVQRIVVPSFERLIQNAASATIAGLDVDVTVRPSTRMVAGANLSYLHSEYGDYTVCIDVFGPCTVLDGGGSTILNPASNLNVNGNQMAYAPELSAFMFVDYDLFTAPDKGVLTLHVDASYRADTYFSPYEIDLHKADSYWLLGAELRYESSDDRWFASVYGRNLTDELYESWIANVTRFLGPLDGAPRYVAWGAPRTYGAEFGFRF